MTTANATEKAAVKKIVVHPLDIDSCGRIIRQYWVASLLLDDENYIYCKHHWTGHKTWRTAIECGKKRDRNYSG